MEEKKMEENKAPLFPGEDQANKDVNVVSDYYSGVQQLELDAANSQVQKARNTLFAVAGLFLVFNLIMLNTQGAMEGVALVLIIVLSAVFFGLGLLTNKQPFAAIIIGLALFVGLWILDIAMLGVEYIFRGIIMRVIVISFLIRGLKHAREAERLRKELRRTTA